MKVIKRLFLLVLFVAQSVWAAESVQDVVDQQINALNQSQAQPLPDEKIKKLGDEIFSKIISLVPESQFYYMVKTWERLTKNKRVLYLTDTVHSALDIPKRFCHDDKCYDLVAVYLPFVDVMLVSEKAPESELQYWVYHELVHAQQYTYRLPIDVLNVMNIVDGVDKNITLKEVDAVDFLKYFYESQANYYVLRMSRNAEWLDYGKSGWSLMPAATLKATLAAATLGQSLRIGHSFFDNYIPSVDQKGWRQGHLHTSRGEMLEFHELIALRNLRWTFNPSVSFDMGFHKDYSQAIEHAYFGKTPFLLLADGGDQKVFKKMHDDYYNELIFARNNIVIGECRALFEKINSMAPFVAWSTLDISEISSCRIFKDFSQLRDRFVDLYMQNKNRFFDKGGEGAHGPALRISPNHYQPQLVIKPPRK